MDFLTFFLYYSGSVFIHQIIVILITVIRYKYSERQFIKNLQNGKVATVTLSEDILDQINGDKKKWN